MTRGWFINGVKKKEKFSLQTSSTSSQNHQLITTTSSTFSKEPKQSLVQEPMN